MSDKKFISKNRIVGLLITLLLTNSVLAQDIESTEKCLTDNAFDDRYASYSPNGESIVFESNREGNWGIFVMTHQGGEVKRVSHNEGTNRRPSWHPDGEKILYEFIADSITELRTIDLKSGKEKIIKSSSYGKEFLFASFSPDGTMIAVSLKENDDKSNILLLNEDGKMIRYVTDNDNRNYYPKWSKNGNELLYFSRKETENKDDEIYRINIKSGKEMRLTNWPKHNFCPSWSANNEEIVYVSSMENTRPEIYLMKANGDHKLRITKNSDGDTLPNWHPSENKILITGYRDGNFQICELQLLDN